MISLMADRRKILATIALAACFIVPATVPGTPMLSAESRDFALSGLPSGPRKISGVVAPGAVSR